MSDESDLRAVQKGVRPLLSREMMIGLGVGVVVLLLVWIPWPRGSDNPTSQPQSKGQQPQSTEQQPQTPAIGGEEVYLDNETGLMWTIKDNGNDFTWYEADQYCRTLNLAGSSGWELPRIDELEKLYDPQSSSTYKIRNPFRLTGWVWSSNMDGSGSAWSFGFHGGRRAHEPMVFGDSNRALCVRRSGK